MNAVPKTPEAAKQIIADKTRERYAAACGISLKQVCEGYASNAKTMLTMYDRALKHESGKYNGYTAAELLENHIYFKILSELPADYVYPVPTCIENCNYFSEVMDMLNLNKKQYATITSIVRHDVRHPLAESAQALEILGAEKLGQLVAWIGRKRY